VVRPSKQGKRKAGKRTDGLFPSRRGGSVLKLCRGSQFRREEAEKGEIDFGLFTGKRVRNEQGLKTKGMEARLFWGGSGGRRQSEGGPWVVRSMEERGIRGVESRRRAR